MPDKHAFGLGRARTEALWRLFFPEVGNDLEGRLKSLKRLANESLDLIPQDSSVMALVFADYVRIEKALTRNAMVASKDRVQLIPLYRWVYHFLMLVPGNEVYLREQNGVHHFDVTQLHP